METAKIIYEDMTSEVIISIRLQKKPGRQAA